MPATTPIARPSGSDTPAIPATARSPGAIVERYAYDPYGRPLTCPLCRAAVSRVRESASRGDMNDDTDMDSGDRERRPKKIGVFGF